MSELKNVSDDSLWDRTYELASQERAIGLLVIRHLREISRRGLHLSRGYSSLYTYAVEHLKYSEGSAARKIAAMKILDVVPDLEKKISEGLISVTSVAQAQILFQAEARSNKPFSTNEKVQFLQKIEGKSKREVEREIARLNPEVILVEKIREVSETKTELKLVLDRELVEKLDQLKNMRSHTSVNLGYQKLLLQLVELGFDKWDETRKHEKRMAKKTRMDLKAKMSLNSPPADMKSHLPPPKSPKSPKSLKSPPPVAVKSRYVNAATRSQVHFRDRDKCQYIEPVSKKRCRSSYLLQIDHCEPFALGGSNELGNLRLLCAAHNRARAESTFGRYFRRSTS